MERLQMCRTCLVEDAPMYAVINKNMHEIYEKLNNKQFVTKDRRPLLVCYFCCSKLKQCCRFQRKCLEAEELFAQMLDEDYELNPLINPDVLEFNNGFVKSPIELISIVGECLTDSHVVKEELPADCERLADIIEPKEELQFDELEREISYYSENSDVEDIPVLHSDSEDDVPLSEVKSEVDEEQETNWAPVAKNPKLHVRRTKPEDTITEEPKGYEQSDSKTIESNSAKRIPQYKEPPTYTKLRADKTIKNNNSVISTYLDTNLYNTSNSGKDDIKCKISNKDMDSDGVNKHRRLCVKEKRYKCDKCQRSFTQKYHLKTHLRMHTGEKPYKCEVCQYSCNQKSTLTRHIRIHTYEKPYKCEVCQYSCIRKCELTRHFRVHTGEKLYKCDECQLGYNQKSDLTNHIRKHTNEKPYKCEVCHYSFSDKSDLKRHIRIHSGEKPYKCEVCQYGFIQKSDLTRHIRIHTNEKQYKCKLCQFCCKQKGYLTKHIRIHTGEKPYKCELCQYSCVDKGDLKRHIRIHTGEKPYKCEVCQYRCSDKGNLIRHIRRHHTGEKP